MEEIEKQIINFIYEKVRAAGEKLAESKSLPQWEKHSDTLNSLFFKVYETLKGPILFSRDKVARYFLH